MKVFLAVIIIVLSGLTCKYLDENEIMMERSFYWGVGVLTGIVAGILAWM